MNKELPKALQVMEALDPHRNLSADQIIVACRNAGLPMIFSIEVLSGRYGVPFSEAKSLVAGHAIWSDLKPETDRLHDALESLVVGDGERDNASV